MAFENRCIVLKMSAMPSLANYKLPIHPQAWLSIDKPYWNRASKLGTKEPVLIESPAQSLTPSWDEEFDDDEDEILLSIASDPITDWGRDLILQSGGDGKQKEGVANDFVQERCQARQSAPSECSSTCSIRWNIRKLQVEDGLDDSQIPPEEETNHYGSPVAKRSRGIIIEEQHRDCQRYCATVDDFR